MKEQNWKAWSPGVLSDASEEELRQVADVEDRIERFFLTLTKREIHVQGLRRRILLAPVNSVAEIAVDEQLKSRRYFAKVASDRAGHSSVTLPGPFAKLSLTPISTASRPPYLGEHNQEIYGKLLGLSTAEIVALRAVGSI
jgi:benzylsuccinate CoA-transferase BbsE subunit